MARFYLQRTRKTEQNPFANREFERFLEIGRGAKRHQLVDAPQFADVILLIGAEDMAMREIRRKPIVQEYRDKCFVFYAGDFVIPFLPGLYPSIDRRWYRDSWTRSVCYARVVLENGLSSHEKKNRKYLYSFRGNVSTSKVRESLLKIQHPKGTVSDTQNARDTDNYHVAYQDEIRESHFVLCPRGAGASSFRVFETMRMGRVPVIISDQWVEPVGPKWSEFSLRIREQDYHSIPGVLESIQKNAEKMGEIARSEWERYFGIETIGDYLIDQCLSIKEAQRHSVLFSRIWIFWQLLHPFYFRRCILSPLVQRASKLLRHIICRQ